MFSKEFGTKTGATASIKYPIQLKKSILCQENLETATVDVLYKETCNFIRKRLQYCEVFKNTYKNIYEWLLLEISTSDLQIYRREVISDFLFYLFKPFSILNFAMTEWFCHVTCFVKGSFLLFFFFTRT